MPQPHTTELYDAFLQPLQSTIRCFTKATLRSEYPFSTGQVFSVQLSDESTPLGRRPVFYLRIAHSYRIAQRAKEWEVQTTSYSYWLLDNFQKELVVYQWDPAEGSKVRTPHLHIRALAKLREAPDSQEPQPRSSNDMVDRLIRAHFPTGHVLLSDILRMAIDDLGVDPLETDRRKVDQRLAAAEKVLRASLAWQTTQ